MIYFIELIGSIILYKTLQSLNYWVNVFLYTIYSVIIKVYSGYDFLVSLISSFIWGLLMVKIYQKIIDICGDSFLVAVLLMGVVGGCINLLTFKILTAIFM